MNKTLLLIFFIFFNLLHAKEPSLELGAGLGTLYYPNYIGSKTTQALVVPLPYIRYRGKYFKIDKDGLTSELFGVNGLSLELSGSGSLPASSEHDGVRKDMPDLDLTFEIGPRLVYNLFEHGVALLEFELPVRAVFSTDFTSIGYQGFTSNPQLKYSLNYSKLEWTLRTGVIFSNQKYHNYFYEVSKEYETTSRQGYKPRSGFGGIRGRVGMTYKNNNWWLGAFVSYTNINDAVFRDSPLVETSNALYSGASVAYIFYTD